MGTTGSESSSTPLNGDQRAGSYQAAIANVLQGDNGVKSVSGELPGTYQKAAYQDPAAMKQLDGGDYSALQASLLKGGEAGLDYAKGRDTISLNDDAAKRGIWSSGLVSQNQKDLDAVYAPQYAAAGATAASTAANLQNSQNQGLNQNAITTAQNANTFNAAQNAQQYQSQWQPADYLKDMWNNTGGTVSTGSSGGWSV